MLFLCGIVWAAHRSAAAPFIGACEALPAEISNAVLCLAYDHRGVSNSASQSVRSLLCVLMLYRLEIFIISSICIIMSVLFVWYSDMYFVLSR